MEMYSAHPAWIAVDTLVELSGYDVLQAQDLARLREYEDTAL